MKTRNRDCVESKKRAAFRGSERNFQQIWVHCHCYCLYRRDCHWRCYRGDKNSLKILGKGAGKGSARYWQKTASLLPGLIGSILSFIFKAAGQGISHFLRSTLDLIILELELDLIILAVVPIFWKRFSSSTVNPSKQTDLSKELLPQRAAPCLSRHSRSLEQVARRGFGSQAAPFCSTMPCAFIDWLFGWLIFEGSPSTGRIPNFLSLCYVIGSARVSFSVMPACISSRMAIALRTSALQKLQY